MVMLAAGALVLSLLVLGLGAFSRARVATIKLLLAWVAAFAGLGLTALLFLTGRGSSAIYGLMLVGPLIWNRWQGLRTGPSPGAAAGSGRAAGRGGMSRAEALEVLGLQEGAAEAEIRAAWVRLMRGAHPDSGGSDWLASRINQAKDVLLRGR